MHGHLVAVEVRVVRGADERMQLQCAAFHQHRLKRLNAQAVQRRRAVQKHRMVLDDAFQYAPDLGAHALHHALGGLDVVGVALFHKLLHYEGLEELKRHFLGQAALEHFQIRAHHDNGTAGIVHAFAQKVLPETALLAAQHIRKGF